MIVEHGVNCGVWTHLERLNKLLQWNLLKGMQFRSNFDYHIDFVFEFVSFADAFDFQQRSAIEKAFGESGRGVYLADELILNLASISAPVERDPNFVVALQNISL
jgi:hypothetical protein